MLTRKHEFNTFLFSCGGEGNLGIKLVGITVLLPITLALVSIGATLEGTVIYLAYEKWERGGDESGSFRVV
jgi:hypothetical protein